MATGDGGEGDFVAQAMRDGAVERLDARGLMPLDEARGRVRAASEFRKGQGRMVRGSFVLDGDVLWAALMSLEDAAEFVREATRLRWFFHPRGQDNIAPLQRYGEGIFPWLAGAVRPDGRLVNVPWCVWPCLLHLDERAVFELLWRVTCVFDGVGDEWPGPFAADNPGDVDRRSTKGLDAPAPAQADDDANGLVIEWIYAHPEVGFPCLARVAEGGDARARRMLKSLAQCGPSDVFAHVRGALGDAEARAIFAAAGAPTELDEGCILTTLDAADDDWPELFGDAPERAYHAMRVVAARAAEGDGWGIAFERVEGDDFASAVLRPYVYGSNVASGACDVEEGLPFSREGEDEEEKPASPFDLDGVRVEGPAGPMELATSMIAERDLRPGWATAEGVTSTRFSLMLRAYLVEHPDAFFTDPREVAARLGLGDDAVVLVVSRAYQHCVGARGPDAYPAAWKVRPGASPVMRSLARALAARDAARFEPGEANLDFRLHALARVDAEHGEEA